MEGLHFMKKFLTILLISTLLLSTNLAEAKAASATIMPTEIEHISDEYYIETIIIEEATSNTLATTKTKTASKIRNITNSNGTVVATFKVTGTFSYDGSTSKCTAVSHSSTINNSSWAFTYRNSSRLTNRAIGHFIAECTQSGTVVQTVSDSVILTCAPDGTLS